MVGVVFGTTFGLPNNAYATCINYIQSQTIAAAYEGDTEPTVHHMDTCSGDDISYQIPIATTVTFDGVEYSNIYATTNSVITFGQPDPTYWAYPNTPSISLYSMDWYPGVSGTSGLDIYYSEGGFQLNLNMVPFGNYGAQPSTVNILVAITNTGGISVAYSYQGPEYQNLRTGVRLHSGSIVSLEEWGATQVSSEEPLPTLQAEPVADPTGQPTPTPTPEPIIITPEEQQEQVAEAIQLAEEISDLNNLIAAINGDSTADNLTPEPEPTAEPTPDSTDEPNLPDPDIEVDPEIVTPDDPRWPDDEQNEPDDPTPSPSPDTTDGESEESDPTPEPSEEPSPQPTDTNPTQEPQPEKPVDEEPVTPAPDNNNTSGTDDANENGISEEELNKLNSLISINDAKLMSAVSEFLNELSPQEAKEFASDLGIKTEEVALVAEIAKENPLVAVAVVQFAERAKENQDAAMPYTLADSIAEVQTEQFLENPIGTIAGMFTELDPEILMSPSEWGKDMTDDQREKLQEIVVSVIIASNIVSAAITRRIG